MFFARSMVGLVVCGILSSFHGLDCGAFAEEPQNRTGLLTVPSKPGPHIEKIEALGDNEWLHLGSPAPDPKWGKARGRSWSSNMPAAPHLRGAFVFAEGVHAYVKPDGHYMNDVWFYDIGAHRWVCLYPGIEVKTIAQKIKSRELSLNEDGLLVTKDGQPLPPLLIHAYGYLGYDPDRRKFTFFGSQFGNYFTTGEKGVFFEAHRLYKEQREGKSFPELSPFYYDVASGRFECFPVKGAPKGQPYGANNLVYVNSKKQFFYGGTDGVWFLDFEKRAWVDAKPQGTPPTGIDHVAAYDPKRDCIYYQFQDKKSSDTLLIYDVKGNRWNKPSPRGTGPSFSSSYESIFSYDPAADKLVVLRLYDSGTTKRGVYCYDPESNSWDAPLSLPPEVVKAIRNGNYGFYDPSLNAYFCHFASDSTDDGQMWVYRFKKRAK